MDLSLSGKRALVTGSTAGIGYGIAAELARLGAEVAVNGRTAERVEAAIGKLKEDVPDGRFVPAPGDVGTAAGASEVVKALPAADVLVNNAGIFAPKPFFEIDDADWERFFQVNVMSAIRLSRHYGPAMRDKGWGRIVFLSSESALQIPVEMVHYGMTKTALLSVSRGLAETLAGSGVTVNAVLPGPTLSEGVETFMKDMAKGEAHPDFDKMGREFIAEHRPTSIIRRLASVAEVANMVAYVCSPAASATTGAALRVDGGVTRFVA